MKFWGIWGLILIFSFTSVAQTDMSKVFSSDNKNIIYINQPKAFTGSPLVFIEGISDKARPKGWMDEVKIKLFGSMTLPKGEIQKPLPPLENNRLNIQNTIKINPLFGNEKEIVFVPHTSDWNFIIQVLDDEDIVVQEEILFVKTEDVPSPIRDWEKQDLTLLDVQINGQPSPYSLEEENDSLRLKLPDLETGIHKLHLFYLIKNAGKFQKSSAKISLPLTKMGWTLPTDSFKGIVLFPVDVKEVKANFLLGKNLQEIKEAFNIEQDSSGNLFFQATHLMPAFSVIQLNIDFKFDSFIQKGLWNKITNSVSLLIFIISLIICLGYLLLNVIEIRMNEGREIFKKKRIITNRFLSFFYRTGEIWMGLIILWIGTYSVLKFMDVSLSFYYWGILIFIPIVFLNTIDHFLLIPQQEKRDYLQAEFRKLKEKRK